MTNMIRLESGHAVVNSLVIADAFGRRHDHVMRTISSLIKDGTIAVPEFGVTSYTDKSNRESKCYDLIEDGFLIAMPYIGGRKARQGQRRLVKEFRSLRDKKIRQAEIGWQQARFEGKDARKHETDVIKDFVTYAKDQDSKSANMYFVNITKMTHKALFTAEKGSSIPIGIRDSLDGMQLTFLATAEHVCANAIRQGMSQGLPYKKIYKLAKSKVLNLSESMGRSVLIESNGKGVQS